ncbi:hypothetical protein DPMN_159267 [Dreissena polymorpha]|uniref:Sushi domain-containing protein n=1 Tax=Dreissena polymorpha TaxID=45954 RepID=A0A9D4ENY5_DREPO|nr:hypothetical protein DPMN_159267 [Dreissena polymorpha]
MKCLHYIPDNPCSAPPGTSNGSPTYSSTDHGATATYKCNTGYQITAGSATRTCSDGTWSGSTPTCGGIISNSQYVIDIFI